MVTITADGASQQVRPVHFLQVSCAVALCVYVAVVCGDSRLALARRLNQNSFSASSAKHKPITHRQCHLLQPSPNDLTCDSSLKVRRLDFLSKFYAYDFIFALHLSALDPVAAFTQRVIFEAEEGNARCVQGSVSS